MRLLFVIREVEMPIFEYRCEKCGHRFESFFRKAEDAEGRQPVCARCASRQVRKLFSVIGIGGMDKGRDSGGCGTRST